MHLVYTNVNDAFAGLVYSFHRGSIPAAVSPSRNGEVIAADDPMTITYRNPGQRVLMNAERDANPFFHLYEALWMLAGCNDVAALRYYNAQMAQYSDDGETFNGAYGYRWRHARMDWDVDEVTGKPFFPSGGKPTHTNADGQPKIDQLEILIAHLRQNPHSRRAVLQMWTVEDDLLQVDRSKDVCCNLSVVFRVETGPCLACNGQNYSMDGGVHTVCAKCGGLSSEQPRYLNMTVFNRSNDLIWGMLGANYVHFTVLQEYMATNLELELGSYHQISANLHLYTERWEPEKWLNSQTDSYIAERRVVPLVKSPAVFDEELPQFVETFRLQSGAEEPAVRHDSGWREPFFEQVASPMLRAFIRHKLGDHAGALAWTKYVEADDWRWAAVQWLNSPNRKHNRKGTAVEKT